MDELQGKINYHGIIANRWLDRNTLRPVFSVDDSKHFASPHRLTTSTVGDELKVSTQGSAIVWSVAAEKAAAILSAGHAADGALWIALEGRAVARVTP